MSGTAGSFSGYLTVWVLCGTTALVAAGLLFFVPKTSFQDRELLAEAAAGALGSDTTE